MIYVDVAGGFPPTRTKGLSERTRAGVPRIAHNAYDGPLAGGELTEEKSQTGLFVDVGCARFQIL
jgi:hypothetical protein